MPKFSTVPGSAPAATKNGTADAVRATSAGARAPLTGDIRNKVDQVWDVFWSGGISNPLEVIEQITYLLFLRRLDEMQTLELAKSERLGTPIERRIFPDGVDEKGRAYEDYRWTRFKNFEAREMFTLVGEHIFPFLRSLGGDGSAYAEHMKNARFTVPSAGLLAKVVDLLDRVPMEKRDAKGDVYEYMLAKIATAGQNGQFRTPRHIIRLMVELTAPTPTDVICDPACGTAGFLVAAGEYLREHHPEALHDERLSKHFHDGLFHGFDFDNTMLRIGSMNMLLHVLCASYRQTSLHLCPVSLRKAPRPADVHSRDEGARE